MQNNKTLRILLVVVGCIIFNWVFNSLHKTSSLHARQNFFNQAIVDQTKEIGLHPNNAADYRSRGMSYLSRSATVSGIDATTDLNKAINDFTKAIELDPNDVYAYSFRADGYDGLAAISLKQSDSIKQNALVQGYFIRAIADYTDAINLKPDDSAIYFKRSIIYLSMKDYDSAWKDIHKAQELGAKISPLILDGLKKASGREN